MHFIASNNDCGVRDYDMERFQLCKHYRFDWPVNVGISSLPYCDFFVLYYHISPFNYCNGFAKEEKNSWLAQVIFVKIMFPISYRLPRNVA
jgi:hypothetical protein